MSDCGCDKAQRELEEFVRNELCSEDAADIRAHMEHCPDCSTELRVNLVLTEAVQRACTEDQAPEELRANVLAQVRLLQAEHCNCPAGSCACGCC